jgi:tetratricopeptide (TPR) repeat protein
LSVRHFWLIAVLVLWTAVIAGCAARSLGPDIAERDLNNEEQATPTPEPAAAADAESEDALARLLQKEMKQPFEKGSGQQKPAKPEKPEKPETTADEPADQISERDLPDEPAAPPAPERQSEPLARQGPLERPDNREMEAAMVGTSGTSRVKAALSLAREGRQLVDKKDYYLAEKRFERALSIDSGCGQAYLGLAELRFSQDQWDQAADLATKAALRLGKQSYFLSRAYLLAAKSFTNTGKLQPAYVQVQKALAVDENNAEANALKLELEARLGVNR